MLVVYAQFSDVISRRPSDATTMATRFFGPFPERPRLLRCTTVRPPNLSPGPRRAGGNDGVVQVTVRHEVHLHRPVRGETRTRRSCRLADPFVNFASFDRNGDGTLDATRRSSSSGSTPTPIRPARPAAARRAASMRSRSTARAWGAERGDGRYRHQPDDDHPRDRPRRLPMRDLYGFGVGSLDISGPTCGPGDGLLFRTSAWQKPISAGSRRRWSIRTVTIRCRVPTAAGRRSSSTTHQRHE